MKVILYQHNLNDRLCVKFSHCTSATHLNTGFYFNLAKLVRIVIKEAHDELKLGAKYLKDSSNLMNRLVQQQRVFKLHSRTEKKIIIKLLFNCEKV